MGLIVRDDPPKVIVLEGREWGEEVNGFVLSALAEPATISVILRNVSHERRELQAPEFANWFVLHVRAEDGSAAVPTPFGRELLRSGSAKAPRPLTLAPGEPVEAQIPIESIFRLQRNATYQVSVSCKVDEQTQMASNTVVFLYK